MADYGRVGALTLEGWVEPDAAGRVAGLTLEAWVEPDPAGRIAGLFLEAWFTPPTFPAQFQGVRIWHSGAVVELCAVATADAPTGMGGQVRIRKGGTTYALYLVETSDADASPVRLNTSAGVKSIRLYTP